MSTLSNSIDAHTLIYITSFRVRSYTPEISIYSQYTNSTFSYELIRQLHRMCHITDIT